MNILGEIAQRTRERVETAKKRKPLLTLRAEAEAAAKAAAVKAGAGKNGAGEGSTGEGGVFGVPPQNGLHAFGKALAAPGMSFICEVKKASPSKGIIAGDFPWLSIAKEYEQAGAAAISCLTEPYWFLGSDQYLKEIVRNVEIPVLRKDFTVDEYMIYEARTLGASAVLLICSILDDGQLKAFTELAKALGMDALVEAHTEREILRAVGANASIIGVNNRNLKDFSVDIDNSRRLRALAPPNVIFVSESGIKTPEDIAALYKNGTDAVLIGETLMRAEDKKKMLCFLAGGRQ